MGRKSNEINPTGISEEIGIRSVEAVENIETAFSRSALRTTTSPQGNERVRAYLIDEDGYCGWTEHNNFAGIVKLIRDEQDVYIAEQHYPNLEGKPTYIWEFIPDADELRVSRQDGDESEPQFDLPVDAEEQQWKQFIQLTKDIRYAYPFHDYEAKINEEVSSSYSFKLDELR